MIAALFVAKDGCYFGLDDIDPWDQARDARDYAGPHAVVAHPPCKRWGRYAKGSPRKPNQYKVGDDQGKFAAALWAVRTYGGVLEHPADSLAWEWYGLMAPHRSGAWSKADWRGGWTCYVEQGHYGHMARKGTWLYACHVEPPSLIWGESEQRLPAYAVERYGYAKARRIGVMAAIGGKDKEKIRDATPVEFRDVLISIARTARPRAVPQPPEL